MQKLLPLVLVCALPSCASIVSKSDYPVTFKSYGAPVKFAVKNSSGETVDRGVTPKNITLSASEGYFKAAKYSVKTNKGTQTLNAGLDPWYAGNLLFGGLIGGVGVDPATGSMWKLPKEHVIR